MDVHDAVRNAPGERPVLPGVELDELVARTNLSEVWKGKRRVDGAPVAVKLATSPANHGMLKLEADTVRALEEAGVSGIVPVEWVDGPLPHLVLPWKGRRTLRDVIEEIRGGDDRSRVLRLLLEVVESVAEVHHGGFMHGDLKPENILVDECDKSWITDFGMARTIRSARLESHISRSMDHSKEGKWGGTLHYLPPEGLKGDAPTPSWDVYAVGVMLHEILLGRRPDRAATPEDLQSMLPADVVEILLGALAYSAADRIRSARMLLRKLRRIRFELTATGPVRWLMRSGRLLLTGLAAFFVALRYSSVFLLLVLYLMIVNSAITVEPAIILVLVPVVGVHFWVRWEGPETSEEARMRSSGGLIPQRWKQSGS